MKINTKITFYISFFLVLFFIGFALLGISNKNSLLKIKDERVKEFETSFKSIIELKDKVYTTVNNDYSYWNELVSFLKSKDKNWAEENLDTIMEEANYDFTAIYNKNNNLIYYSQFSKNKNKLQERFKDITLNMNKPVFYNFYIKENDTLIKLFIAPIQQKKDFKRTSKPKGYMLIGKIISRKYIEEIELITKQKIKIINAEIDEDCDFTYPLLSQDKKSVSFFGVQIHSKTIDKAEEIFNHQLMILFITALLLLITISFLIYRFVVNPIRNIEKVILKTESIDFINDLLVQKNEFGSIANSIKKHISQNHLLSEYKDTVDLSSIVSKADDKGKITYVNEKFCEISGYSKEELIGKSHSIIKHPDEDASIYKDIWNTIKNKKETWYGKIKNKAKNGTAYYVNTIIKPILDIQGNIIEYIAIRHDITSMEESKNELKKQYSIASDKYDDVLSLSKLYEEAIEESNIILRVDLHYNISYCNEQFSEISGYSREELINQPYSIINHPDVDTNDINQMWEELKDGKIWKGKLKNISKKGHTFHSLATIVPIKNKEGLIIEYIGIRKDITELVNLHNEIEETQRELIYKLGEIGETRSKETGNHVKRVAEYSKLLALKAGLLKEDAELLKYASPMHDIGKIGIPDSILNKPGKLTYDEFEIMKSHANIGYEMLKGSNRPILQTSAIVANEHHEKWDGSGYPKGLKGENIHIYGRVTAIADVFDALASDRAYKKAWDLEKILTLFKEQRGKHFDPHLIDLFFENLDDFLEIRNKIK